MVRITSAYSFRLEWFTTQFRQQYLKIGNTREVISCMEIILL